MTRLGSTHGDPSPLSAPTLEDSATSKPFRQATVATLRNHYALSGLVCALVLLPFLIVSPRLVHWFVIPLFVCGVLIGSEAIAWVLGRLELFDPRALIGILGFHFFFLSPILQIHLQYGFPGYLRDLDDWRPWLGVMGLINVVGIVLYLVVQSAAYSKPMKVTTIRVAVPKRTALVLAFSMLVGCTSLVLFFWRIGGFSGAAQAYTDRSDSLYGTGLLRIGASGFALVVFIAGTLYWRSVRWSPVKGAFLIGFIALLECSHFVAVGLSTDRGLIVTATLWMLMIVHFFWHRLNRAVLVPIAAAVGIFLWVYSFYKSGGLTSVDYLREGTSVTQVAEMTNRSFSQYLIGDLSRCDVQAYILHVQWENPDTYRLRFGQTYLTSIYPVIPRWIWPSNTFDSGKVVAGTDALFGESFYQPYSPLKSNFAYGLAGEAMLNFGIWPVPLAYALLGFLVGRFRRYVGTLVPGDCRFLLVPYGVLFLPNMLLWDSDNYIAHWIGRASFAFLTVILMTARRRVKAQCNAPSFTARWRAAS